MKENKIGQLILTKRKEKELTQQELGDILGVSSKTISKWECGYGLPDITILKKISKEFNITIEELLDGEIKDTEKEYKEENYYHKTNIKNLSIIKIILISLPIILIIITFIKLSDKRLHEDNSTIKQNNCTVIRTYNVKNIEPSNDGNYLYITVNEYQIEGVFTVKLPRAISKGLKEGNSYIFTFKTTSENLDTTTDIIFNNAEIINIKYTDKKGMETESRSYCDNR